MPLCQSIDIGGMSSEVKAIPKSWLGKARTSVIGEWKAIVVKINSPKKFPSGLTLW
jgi:hypothetical protein